MVKEITQFTRRLTDDRTSRSTRAWIRLPSVTESTNPTSHRARRDATLAALRWRPPYGESFAACRTYGSIAGRVSSSNVVIGQPLLNFGCTLQPASGSA